MSKGYINVAGQGGRKIYAAYTQDSPEGKRIILVTEHVLSECEITQNVRATDYPLTIAKIQFDAFGRMAPQSHTARVSSLPPGSFLLQLCVPVQQDRHWLDVPTLHMRIDQESLPILGNVVL